MINGEPIKTHKVGKRVEDVYDIYILYFSVLSALGLSLTKVQVRVLAAIAWRYSTLVISAKEKKAITELANTTPQVVENTLVVLRKKGVLKKNNVLNEKFYFSGTNVDLTINLRLGGRN